MSLEHKFRQEAAVAGLRREEHAARVITETDVAPLPVTARRYLRFMRVVGRGQDWSFRLAMRGRFRTKPRGRWMNCETWQYNSRIDVARIFHIRVRFAGLASVIARDTYLNGTGHMRIRLMDRITVGEGRGAEFDIGELVTYLNDAVMICPTMLFVPAVSWSEVDDSSFDLAFTDHGLRISARVFVDAGGAPIDFTTTDRFCYDPANPKALLRAGWRSPIAGWQIEGDRPIPVGGRAIWELPDGPFDYAEFKPVRESLAFNVGP
ncbi:MAG TPA: DUF6544 family protein [Verrucomicrobiae bacterium]|nr:DUF6544 family protein [Verrucomicrobiae bacterium]